MADLELKIIVKNSFVTETRIHGSVALMLGNEAFVNNVGHAIYQLSMHFD